MTMPTPGDDKSTQPAYVDPITGAPLYVDPATGQLAYGTTQPPAHIPATVSLPVEPAVTLGPPATGNEPQAPAYIPSGFPAGDLPAGYPPAAGGPRYPIGVNPYASPSRTNGMAIASLVVSIASLLLIVCYGLGGVIGLVGAVLGHVARGQIRQRNEAGAGLALAGIIIGWISLVVGLVIIGFVVYIFMHLNEMDAGYTN